MELLIFLVVPVAVGVLQYKLTASCRPAWVKWIPFLSVLGLAVLTLLATFNRIDLPHTYFFDDPSMFPLPDYVYLAVISCSTLCGITLGALVGTARTAEE